MESIINKHWIKIFTYCINKLSLNSKSIISNRLSVKDSAKDITSDTFFKFYKNYGESILSETVTRAILYRISDNLIKDYWRKNSVKEKFLTKEKNISKNFHDKNDLYYKSLKHDVIEAVNVGVVQLTAAEYLIFHSLFFKMINPNSNIEVALETGLSVEQVSNTKRTLFAKIRSYLL